MTEATTSPGRTVTRTPKTPHIIDKAENLTPGSRRVVEIDGRSVGVLNVDGKFFALANNCPHHGAPLCEGPISGTMEDSAPHEYRYGRHNEFISCPWHGYEFRLDTGRPLVDMGRMRVRTYAVEVVDGNVVVYS